VGYGQTDVGRTRDQNEDSMFVDDVLGLYVVADGMGGHAAGEVASATAIETVVAELKDQQDAIQSFRRGEGEAETMLGLARDAAQKACGRVYQLATSDDGRAGMGCTLTMLLVLNTKAAIVHVGDSRLYLLRNGKMSQLTSDHTMANELCQAGLITAEEVKDHQYAHVLTRAIGTQPTANADVLMMDVVPGDRFLLCSDGLADHVEDDSWLGGRLGVAKLSSVPEDLVCFANEAGGHDNVTVIAVAIEPDDPEIEIVDEMSTEVQGKFEALQSMFLFQGLSLALLTRVLNTCDLNTYAPGDVVIREGEPCSELYIVIEGRFALRQGTSERELGPSDHVREPFWSLIKTRPWLGVGLLERLGRRLSVDLASAERDGI
jgi:serine/threonine protein phosphatase PrpC